MMNIERKSKEDLFRVVKREVQDGFGIKLSQHFEENKSEKKNKEMRLGKEFLVKHKIEK